MERVGRDLIAWLGWFGIIMLAGSVAAAVSQTWHDRDRWRNR